MDTEKREIIGLMLAIIFLIALAFGAAILLG